MGKVEGASAHNYHSLNAVDTGNVATDDGNKAYGEKLIFTPAELGLGGRRPATVVLTERQVETKIFEKYGFDARNPVQMQMLRLRFDTQNSPFSEIDWNKGQFVARLNAKGQYEITVGLRERTLEALSGRLLFSAPNNGGATDADPNVTTASRLGINGADYRRRQIENKLNPQLAGLTPEQRELILDLTQVGLSLVGIFDPTGVADGADALISLGRRDYWGASVSALGIIPYLGDIAKVGKLPKFLKIIERTVDVAKQSPEFAKAVTPLLSKIKNALDNISLNQLPDWAKKPVESLKNKIDEFFGRGANNTPNGVEPPKAPRNRTEPPLIKKVEVDDVMLPATTRESVESKLWTYLLDPNHIQGGPKAKWFKEALGFTRENMDDLAKQIIFDPSKAIKTADSPHGQKFNQVISIAGANGRKIDVNFGWIKNNDGVVRLTTGIPAKK